jgi:hypothetical protein
MNSNANLNEEYSHVLSFSLKANVDNYLAAGWELIDTVTTGDEATLIYRLGWHRSAGEPANFPPKIDEVLPPRPPEIDETK